MRAEDLKMPKDKFVFAKNNNIHDKELVTKPIGYFHDAWNRFKKNKGSIFAACIIGLILLFVIFGPLCTPYKVSDMDNYMKYCQPKSHLSQTFGWDFWDGCEELTVNEIDFSYYYAIGEETGHYPIKNQSYVKTELEDGSSQYTYRYDTYQRNGCIFVLVNEEQYLDIQKYQNETGIQIIYPITSLDSRPTTPQNETDANFWYKTKTKKNKTLPVLDENGNYQNIYEPYDPMFDNYDSLRIEGETPLYNYGLPNQSGYQIRVCYYEYYIYQHKVVINDSITEPLFIFGSTHTGRDIFTCLGEGARFSFILAIVINLINTIIGTIYGAIEGYYGGKTDLVMERIVEILVEVPTMVIISLLKYHMENVSAVVILIIAFILTGWIGMAGLTRMQFYRFKNQEYVLAARTLGAKDRRIMFKHIFPNSLGTIITSCVLFIPGMIFSETTLSYLGIIDLSTGDTTSVGTLLADAQNYLTSYPYMMVPPAVFICLLMLSFNLFGNGLRDAFNPSLRGTED